VIVFESKKQRRLVVRLERGEELVASVTRLAKEEKIGSAWVRGSGSLAWVELTRHDQRRRRSEPPQRFDSPCEVLALEGSLSRGVPVLHVALSRRTDNGVDALGGQLVSAEVFAMELLLECFEDVRLEREMDDATGLASWAGTSREGVRAEPRAEPPSSRAAVTLPPTAASVVSASAAASSRVRRGDGTAAGEPVNRGLTQARDEDDADDEEDPQEDALRGAPSSVPPRSVQKSGGVSWADVAAVSAAPEVAYAPPRRERAESPGARPPPIPDKRQMFSSELDEPVPGRGDFVQHRQFGLCKIDREDKDGGLVIRLPSGVRKTIKLDFMEVGQPFDEGGRRVFPIRPRKK
jgi:predicted DNA-binding protein with PD1-like motif